MGHQYGHQSVVVLARFRSLFTKTVNEINRLKLSVVWPIGDLNQSQLVAWCCAMKVCDFSRL